MRGLTIKGEPGHRAFRSKSHSLVAINHGLCHTALVWYLGSSLRLWQCSCWLIFGSELRVFRIPLAAGLRISRHSGRGHHKCRIECVPERHIPRISGQLCPHLARHIGVSYAGNGIGKTERATCSW